MRAPFMIEEDIYRVLLKEKFVRQKREGRRISMVSIVREAFDDYLERFEAGQVEALPAHEH